MDLFTAHLSRFFVVQREAVCGGGGWVARHGWSRGAGPEPGIRRGQRLVRAAAIRLDCCRSDACGHRTKYVRKKCIGAGLYADFVHIFL